MTHRHWQILIVGLVVSIAPPESAHAQQPSAWFGELTLGPAFHDRQGNKLLAGHGLVVQGRVGRRLGSTFAAVFELTHTSFNRSDVVFLPDRTSLAMVPCDPVDPLCGLGGSFTGPVKVAVAGAGLEASTGDSSAILFGSLTPGVYWIHEHAPGNNPVSGGLGLSLGGGVRLAEPLWAVVDVHYHRLFSEGQNPRWLVPLSFGLQIR